MSTLTAALYGALVVYLGGWFFGYWSGNFALLLFTLTVVTFVYWLGERLRFKPATRVENACATGSAAVHQAVRAVKAGSSPSSSSSSCCAASSSSPSRSRRARWCPR